MSNEGMPNGFNRGPSAAARDRAIEYKDVVAARGEEVNRMGEELVRVQNQISKLKEGLKKGPEHASRRGGAVDDLAMELYKKNQEEIKELEVREGELKQRIQEKGGDPEKYTVQ